MDGEDLTESFEVKEESKYFLSYSLDGNCKIELFDKEGASYQVFELAC